ncbi:MAG: hypothetical protein JWN40_2843 [Phycisphaerales bacterium]|nr:hypothetical protein [Phycisphaerales bacterium]
MEQRPVQFTDDPALKSALRRTLDVESAPAALRERVMALKAGGDAQAGNPIPMFRRRSPLYWLAVAAVLVLGVGMLGYQIWQMNRGPVYDPSRFALSQSLYKAMVDAHSARAKEVGTGDIGPVATAANLSQSIQRPVFVADLTRDGWTYRGAGVRNVGSNTAAQLYFTKGKQAISVFSLPASTASGAREDEEYDKDFNGSPIAGFTHGPGLYCIVGSSEDDSLPLAEVKRLLAAHRGEISKG